MVGRHERVPLSDAESSTSSADSDDSLSSLGSCPPAVSSRLLRTSDVIGESVESGTVQGSTNDNLPKGEVLCEIHGFQAFLDQYATKCYEERRRAEEKAEEKQIAEKWRNGSTSGPYIHGPVSSPPSAEQNHATAEIRGSPPTSVHSVLAGGHCDDWQHSDNWLMEQVKAKEKEAMMNSQMDDPDRQKEAVMWSRIADKINRLHQVQTEIEIYRQRFRAARNEIQTLKQALSQAKRHPM